MTGNGSTPTSAGSRVRRDYIPTQQPNKSGSYAGNHVIYAVLLAELVLGSCLTNAQHVLAASRSCWVVVEKDRRSLDAGTTIFHNSATLRG
jgi:hypothetical protein